MKLLGYAIVFLCIVLSFLWGRHTGRVETKILLTNWLRNRLVESAQYKTDGVTILAKLSQRLKEL